MNKLTLDRIWDLYMDAHINCYECVLMGMSQLEFERRHERPVDWDWDKYLSQVGVRPEDTVH